MKKFLIAGVIALALAGTAFGADAVTKGYISVNVEAAEDLSPNSVKLSFAIETCAQDVKTAADNNKNSSQKAIDAIKSLIDTAKGESIKTTSYNLNPEYNYKDGNRKLTGYMVSNTLEVELKDVEKAGKVISAALSNGASSVKKFQLVLDETNGICNTLIQKVSKDARVRADKIAESMGTSVLGIKCINAGCTTSQNTNVRMLSATTEANASADSSVPIEAGKTKLRAYVNAEFFVK